MQLAVEFVDCGLSIDGNSVPFAVANGPTQGAVYVPFVGCLSVGHWLPRTVLNRLLSIGNWQ